LNIIEVNKHVYPLIAIAVLVGAGCDRTAFGGSEEVGIEVQGQRGKTGGGFCVKVASFGVKCLRELWMGFK
jgi:hypothetical protein